MIPKATRLTLGDHSLHRLTLEPITAPQGGLVFFHGQGDFIDRYPPILSPFVDVGYRCVLTDLPGHGRSSGKRGHVPGLSFIDELLTNSLDQLEGPLVIAGHSMGGLMALRLLLLNPGQFQAAWFSSPLLSILDRTHPILAQILPRLARLIPRFTIGTGVTSEQCGDFGEGPRTDRPEEGALFHSRISLGWGAELCRATETVWQKTPCAPPATPVLLTQGAQDPVCPPGLLKDLLGQASFERKTIEMIPEALHEPFSGSSREDFMARLRSWIETTLVTS